MASFIQRIKNHFDMLGYKIDMVEDHTEELKKFSHNIIFLQGKCSIRLFRLVQKYFGNRVHVINTNKTRVIIFNFNPDGHADVTGVCKVCGCADHDACPGGCYWTEADVCSACMHSEAYEKLKAQGEKKLNGHSHHHASSKTIKA